MLHGRRLQLLRPSHGVRNQRQRKVRLDSLTFSSLYLSLSPLRWAFFRSDPTQGGTKLGSNHQAMRFRYWATGEDGKAQDGVLNAPSPESARRKLEAKGMSVLSLETDDPLPASSTQPSPIAVADLLPARERLSFFLQMSVLLKSGIPITLALDAVAENAEEALAATADAVLESVEEGHPLSEAMARTAKFDRVTLSLLRIAEKSGQLVLVYERVANRIRKLQMRRQETVAALAYPAAIAAVSALLLAALIYFMLPQFTAIFAELGGELPALTRFLLFLGNGPWIPLMFGLLVLLLVGLYATRNQASSKLLLEKLTYESPLVGPLARKSLLSRLSTDLGLMLDLGIPIDKALGQLNDPTSGYYAMDEALRVAQVELRATGELVGALAQTELFPPIWLQMVQVGFESGRLPQMLNSYARLTETEVENETDSLTQLLEPLLLGIMGLAVGAIVLSAFLPMYGLLGKL